MAVCIAGIIPLGLFDRGRGRGKITLRRGAVAASESGSAEVECFGTSFAIQKMFAGEFAENLFSFGVVALQHCQVPARQDCAAFWPNRQVPQNFFGRDRIALLEKR